MYFPGLLQARANLKKHGVGVILRPFVYKEDFPTFNFANNICRRDWISTKKHAREMNHFYQTRLKIEFNQSPKIL